jgi:histidine triad (HIT) family protein
MADCIFCRIARGEVPAKLVLSDDRFVAFHDIAPQAPTHILVIPRQHLRSLDATEDTGMLGELLALARRVAREAGVAESGYRTVINTNRHGGQAVDHLHVHVLGGRQMTWPPG